MSEAKVERLSRREAIALAEEAIQKTGLGGFYSHPGVYRPALAELIIAAKQWDEHSAALSRRGAGRAMNRVKRDVHIDQNAAADLVRVMITEPPWCEHAWARVALMLAARAIERGRHLTGAERMINLRAALFRGQSSNVIDEPGAPHTSGDRE